MKKKTVKLAFGEEFLDYFDDIKVEEWMFITDEHLSFLNVAGIEKKDYSMKRFKAGLEKACEVFGFKFEERKCREAENRKQFRIL